MYLVKYDTSGNVIWIKTDSGNCSFSSLNTDVYGNVYVLCSSFPGTEYSLGTGYNVTGSFSIAKYDEYGEIVWLKNAGSSSTIAQGGQITLDPENNIYVSGNSNADSILFAPDYLLFDNSFHSYCSSDTANMFLAKLSNPESVPILPTGSGQMAVYPSPGGGLVNVSFATQGYKELQVYDVLGRVAMSRTLTGNEWQTTLELSYLPSGVYYLRAAGNSGTVTKSFVIRH